MAGAGALILTSDSWKSMRYDTLIDTTTLHAYLNDPRWVVVGRPVAIGAD